MNIMIENLVDEPWQGKQGLEEDVTVALVTLVVEAHRPHRSTEELVR